MPKLLFFIIAERAIVAQDLTVSLITTFHGIKIAVDAEKALAETNGEVVGIALSWSGVAAWLAEEAEAGKIFQEQLLVKLPDGKQVTVSELEFIPAARVHHTIHTMVAFPFIGPGAYDVGLVIREKESQEGWTAVAVSPINVETVAELPKGYSLPENTTAAGSQKKRNRKPKAVGAKS